MIKEINTSPPDQNVIDKLEGLLEMAKAGEIQSIAFAMVMSDLRTGNGWAGMGKNNTGMLGEIMILERDMTDLCVEIRIDPITGEERF